MKRTHRQAVLVALATGLSFCAQACQPAESSPTPEPTRGAGGEGGRNRDDAAARAKKTPPAKGTRKGQGPDDGWSSNGSNPKPAQGTDAHPCGPTAVPLAGACFEAVSVTELRHTGSGDRRYVVAAPIPTAGDLKDGLLEVGSTFKAIAVPTGGSMEIAGTVRLRFMASADGLEHRIVSTEVERAELVARDWKVEVEVLACDKGVPHTVPLRAFRQEGSGRVVHSIRAGADCAGAKDLDHCGREDLTGFVDAGVGAHVFL